MHTRGRSEPIPGAERPVLHTGGRSGQVPGAGRAVLHTGSRGGQVPGAERAVLHTGGRSGQVPGAERAVLHTGSRSGQVPGAGRADLHTGGGRGQGPGARRPDLHTGLRKKHYLCKVDNKTFNKYFSVFIMVGMTVVTILATALKFVPADTEARWLLIFAAFGSLMGVAATVASASGKIITFLFGLIER